MTPQSHVKKYQENHIEKIKQQYNLTTNSKSSQKQKPMHRTQGNKMRKTGRKN